MKKHDFVEIMRQTHAPLEKMLEMVPDTKLSWAPAAGFMTFGQLIKHISENWCLIKDLMVTNQWPPSSPEEMAEAMKLENVPSGIQARGHRECETRPGERRRVHGARSARKRSSTRS